MTEDEYIEKLRSELEKTFENYTVKIENEENASIGGLDCKALKVTVQIDAGEAEQFYYIKKLDSFIMSISVTASPGTDIEGDVLSFFEPMDSEE